MPNLGSVLRPEWRQKNRTWEERTRRPSSSNARRRSGSLTQAEYGAAAPEVGRAITVCHFRVKLSVVTMMERAKENAGPGLLHGAVSFFVMVVLPALLSYNVLLGSSSFESVSSSDF
ncbi:unnamed protein product, partial [Phaeothamnion confervicola]